MEAAASAKRGAADHRQPPHPVLRGCTRRGRPHHARDAGAALGGARAAEPALAQAVRLERPGAGRLAHEHPDDQMNWTVLHCIIASAPDHNTLSPVPHMTLFLVEQ